MKPIQHALIFLLLGAPTLALAATPTKESVEKLFAVAHVEQTVTAKQTQVATAVRRLIEQALPAQSRKPETKAFLDAHAASFSTRLEREFCWEALKGEFARIYQEAYTQAEVDAQIAFYETEAGKAVAEKAPLLAINTSQLMQDRATPLVQQATKEAIEEAMKLQQRKKK